MGNISLYSWTSNCAGGYLGSRLGAQWLMPKTLIRLLSAALLVSGLKFLFT